MYSFKGLQNNKNHAFHQSAEQAMKKRLIVTHFTMKIVLPTCT